jgi:6-phosphogluconolactonase
VTAGRVSGDLNVLDTPQLVAAAVADAFVSDAKTAIAEHGIFFVALAGGSTPKTAYQLLAQPPRRDLVDWPHVHVFFGDERCVPPGSDESNYKMASDAMLHNVAIPKQNVHRMHGEDDPARAAAQYATLLVEMLGKPPRFDLIMLGMGADGHTASLFPGTDPHVDEGQFVRAVYVEKLSAHRVTLTPLVINSARHVLVATEGLPKAPALYAVLKGPYDPRVHPIQVVAPVQGRLSWYVDRAAAAELAPK